MRPLDGPITPGGAPERRKPTPEELQKQMPPGEREMRRKMGVALLEFMQWLEQTPVAEKIEPGERQRKMEYDVPMLEHRHEQLRQVVEEAAAMGIETALPWHTLGMWCNDWRERIEFFTRALACVESGRDRALMPRSPRTDWTEMHTRTDCLYEIGRAYANEGEPEKARGFLERALPLAQETERLRGRAGIRHEDRLEGKIAALLVQLPEAGGGTPAR